MRRFKNYSVTYKSYRVSFINYTVTYKKMHCKFEWENRVRDKKKSFEWDIAKSFGEMIKLNQICFYPLVMSASFSQRSICSYPLSEQRRSPVGLVQNTICCQCREGEENKWAVISLNFRLHIDSKQSSSGPIRPSARIQSLTRYYAIFTWRTYTYIAT